MTPTEVTLFISVITVVVTAIIAPGYLYYRNRKSQGDANILNSWEKIQTVLSKERDDLRVLLNESEEQCRVKLRAMEEDYTQQLSEISRRLVQERLRTTNLESQVDDLHARLYRQGQS